MTRHRLLNKYTLFVFVFVLIFLLVAWFFSSDTYRLIFKIPLEEIKEYTTTQSKWEYFQFINELRSFIILGTRSLYMLMPLLSVFAAWHFQQEKDGYFPLAYGRVKHYPSFVLRSIGANLFCGCFAMFSAYVIYFVIGHLLFGGISMEYLPSQLFEDLLGYGFNASHPYLFHLIEAILVYFIVGGLYGLFSIVVSLYTSKKFLVVGIPAVYFYVMSLLSSYLSEISFYQFNSLSLCYFFTCLNPSYPLFTYGYAVINVHMVFASIWPLFLVLVVLLAIRLKGAERIDA